MNDFEYQLGFVIDSSWRMIEMQDRDPKSPSHGCFHYAYWRDKTSEFPDARFQEAGATMGMLTLPRIDDARQTAGLPPADALYRSFSAALGNWARTQYPEGCWDEWYKGERGFAATEFTMIAYGLATRYMGDNMQADDRERLCATIDRAAAWLATRHDRVKANHEAAAGAALALAWETTGNDAWKAAAREKITDALSRQTDEGWFPEIGGMDLGYCSVLLDYVMIYVLVTGDATPVAAMQKLVAFMAPHLHPDATISAEAGLCLNPYVSRIGFGLLSSHGDENAAAIIENLKNSSSGRAGLTTYLADDLRLCRWSYLPVITMLERDGFRGGGAMAGLFPEGWTVREHSAIAACHHGQTHVYVSVAGGGAVRVFAGGDLIAEDLGIDIVTEQNSWGSAGYSLNRPITQSPNGVLFRSGMGKAAYFYPGFLSRLVLRMGSTTPLFSRLLRQLIDRVRIRMGTAINQSAAPLAESGDGYGFERQVLVDGNTTTIIDSIDSKDGQVESTSLRLNLQLAGMVPDTEMSSFSARRVTITKRISATGNSPEFSIETSHE